MVDCKQVRPSVASLPDQTDLFLFPVLPQIFPLKVDPRWPGPPPSQLSLALQQALAKELMRAKQGQIQQGGLAFRLLQAIAALLTSAHAGPIVMSMHRSHALSCPLMRQLHLYQVFLVQHSMLVHNTPSTIKDLFLFLFLDVCFFQRLVSQDIAFSSLFLKVIVEMLIWLDNPPVEAGPLKTLLRSFAGQNSQKLRHSDGESLNSFSNVALFILYKQWVTSFCALQCVQVSSTWLRLWLITEILKCRWEPSLQCWKLETDVMQNQSSLEKVILINNWLPQLRHKTLYWSL